MRLRGQSPHVPHRPRPPRDPAQHGQRDPPRREHRLRAAPDRAARLSRWKIACCAAPASTTTSSPTCAPPCKLGGLRPRGGHRSPALLRVLHARHHGHAGLGRRWRPGDSLVFGSESAGLPQALRAGLPAARLVRLPMLPGQRSLNLGNAVAVAVFEAWRRNGYAGSVPALGPIAGKRRGREMAFAPPSRAAIRAFAGASGVPDRRCVRGATVLSPAHRRTPHLARASGGVQTGSSTSATSRWCDLIALPVGMLDALPAVATSAGPTTRSVGRSAGRRRVQDRCGGPRAADPRPGRCVGRRPARGCVLARSPLQGGPHRAGRRRRRAGQRAAGYPCPRGAGRYDHFLSQAALESRAETGAAFEAASAHRVPNRPGIRTPPEARS